MLYWDNPSQKSLILTEGLIAALFLSEALLMLLHCQTIPPSRFVGQQSPLHKEGFAATEPWRSLPCKLCRWCPAPGGRSVIARRRLCIIYTVPGLCPRRHLRNFFAKKFLKNLQITLFLTSILTKAALPVSREGSSVYMRFLLLGALAYCASRAWKRMMTVANCARVAFF